MRKSTILMMGVLLLGMGSAQANSESHRKHHHRHRERHTRLYCRFHREIVLPPPPIPLPPPIPAKGKGGLLGGGKGVPIAVPLPPPPPLPVAIEECWARARVCHHRERDRDFLDGQELLDSVLDGQDDSMIGENNERHRHHRRRRRCRERLEVACTNGFFYRDGAHRSFHNGWEYLNGNIGGDPSIKFEGGRIFDFEDDDDGDFDEDFHRRHDSFETISFLRAGGIEFAGHCRVLHHRRHHHHGGFDDDELDFEGLSEVNSSSDPSMGIMPTATSNATSSDAVMSELNLN